MPDVPGERELVFGQSVGPRTRFMQVGEVPLYAGQNTYQDRIRPKIKQADPAEIALVMSYMMTRVP